MPKESVEINSMDLAKKIQELEKLGKLSKKQEEELALYKWKLSKELLGDEKEEKKKNEEELHKLRIEKYDAEGKVLKKKFEEAFGSLDAALSTVSNVTGQLTDKVDSVITKYIDAQQKLQAGLIGTDSTLTEVTRTLTSALSATNLVKQEEVYNKLSSLVSSGIVYNVEQRAFLETLSDDIGLSLSNTSEALNRLIQIQKTDLYSNRLAIQYSLKEFLNQNYDTSSYIKEAFTTVSESLLETQALTSAGNAVDIETAVQSWLGSYYSAGVDKKTVTGLADAINALGSGDVSGLGSGLSNLVLMGVARSGLDYGEILNSGLDQSKVNQIMSNITDYLIEMGGNSSNVVMSQLSNLYGVNVADLIAARKVSGSGEVSSNISGMLSDYGDLVPWTTQLSNSLENLYFSWGTNIASSKTGLISYKLEEMIADNIGSMLAESKNSITSTVGIALKSLPLVTLLGSLVGTNTLSNLGNMAGSIFGTNSSSNLYNIFQALSDVNTVGGSKLKISGSGVSASATLQTGDTNGLISKAVNSTNDFESSITKYTGDEKSQEENIDTIANTTTQILSFLENRLSGVISSSVNLDSKTTTNVSYSYNGGLGR